MILYNKIYAPYHSCTLMQKSQKSNEKPKKKNVESVYKLINRQEKLVCAQNDERTLQRSKIHDSMQRSGET